MGKKFNIGDTVYCFFGNNKLDKYYINNFGLQDTITYLENNGRKGIINKESCDDEYKILLEFDGTGYYFYEESFCLCRIVLIEKINDFGNKIRI